MEFGEQATRSVSAVREPRVDATVGDTRIETSPQEIALVAMRPEPATNTAHNPTDGNEGVGADYGSNPEQQCTQAPKEVDA